MARDIADLVVVGGGLAGAKAAEAARAHGYEGRLTLVAEEAERPYDRPPLSKGMLLGSTAEEDVYIHPDGFYAEQGIDLHLDDPAVAVDRSAGVVRTRGGRRVPFDRLLLATGAAPRGLPVTGADLDGVVTLRSLADSRRLAARLRAAEHVTVVGAGWIGCEVAAAARGLGTAVTMVDPLDVPLRRSLGPEIGRLFAGLHADHGVELLLGGGVAGLRGGHAVEQVVLSDGRTVDSDLVVVGIGAVPRTALAEEAGLDVDDGVLADSTLATSDPRILAAGDVAGAWLPLLGRHLRVEHWANALNQGLVAGRNLVGAGEPYDRVPYVFTDQYDVGMEYSGHAGEQDEVVVRGATDAWEFIAFWLRDGRVVAGMNVNVWDVVEDIQWLVRSGTAVDRGALADPEVPLAALAEAGRPARS